MMLTPPPTEWPQLPRRPFTPKAKRGEARPACGRKFCSCCGRWRHLVEFDVAHRTKGGAPLYWQARCRVCHANLRRVRHGHRRKDPGRGSPEVRRARAREWQRQRLSDPAKRADKREYDRIWHEAKRRAAGIPERRWGSGSSRGDQTVERVSNAPIREAFLQSEVTAADLAQRLGWFRPDGHADTDRVRRDLGLKLESDRRGRRYRETMGIERAGQVIRALGLVPADFGL